MKNYIFIFIIINIGLLSSAQTYQRSYGNDDVQISQGPYTLFTESNGISVYVAWVNSGNKAIAACFKVENHTGNTVIVSWGGPKWFYNGPYINKGNQTGYSDKFNPGEIKDGIYHKPGNNGTEVYKFRPNWLYYTMPEDNLTANLVSVQLMDFEVLPYH